MTQFSHGISWKTATSHIQERPKWQFLSYCSRNTSPVGKNVLLGKLMSRFSLRRASKANTPHPNSIELGNAVLHLMYKLRERPSPLFKEHLSCRSKCHLRQLMSSSFWGPSRISWHENGGKPTPLLGTVCYFLCMMHALNTSLFLPNNREMSGKVMLG